MIVCEYFFKGFYSRGSEEYLNAWAAEIDRMCWEGWEVLDSTRRLEDSGFWTVVLVRPPRAHSESSRRSDCVLRWQNFCAGGR
jgi:hypothetical protein